MFTLEPEQFPEVDHLVLDEAEETLPAFLTDLARGVAKRVYSSANRPSLQQTPTPLWNLADLRLYATMSVQYSRGCPFDCDFCNITSMFGHRPRVKTTAQILTELNGLRHNGWRGAVFFVDDNFIGHRRSLKKELLPALIQWQQEGRHMPFFTEASIDLADDPELMQMMVNAGFNQVFVGIETPTESGLAECNKRQNLGRDLVADVKRIQRAGLEVQGGFIVGFDSDTASVFPRHIEFIQKSGIVTAMVGLLQAIPGTKLYQRLNLQGRLLGATTGDNVDGATNFVSRMNRETLRRGYRSLMSYIYSPSPYYRRIRAFLKEFQPPKVASPVSGRDLLAFVLACLRLGVLGRERFHYWHLLLWTLLRRPTLFSRAVTLTIYGHHFRKICRVLRR